MQFQNQGPDIVHQNCITEYEDYECDETNSVDDFTEALSYKSDDSEIDCDCFEDYTCEWHSYPKRYDSLYEEALYVFEGRCKTGGPNPTKKAGSINDFVIRCIHHNVIELNASSKTMSDACRISLFANTITLACTQPAINHTKYTDFVLSTLAKCREMRETYPTNIHIQRAYRDWCRFVLDVI